MSVKEQYASLTKNLPTKQLRATEKKALIPKIEELEPKIGETLYSLILEHSKESGEPYTGTVVYNEDGTFNVVCDFGEMSVALQQLIKSFMKTVKV